MTRFLVLISRITFFGGKALVSQYLSAMYSCKGTYIAKGTSQYAPQKKNWLFTPFKVDYGTELLFHLEEIEFSSLFNFTSLTKIRLTKFPRGGKCPP
jgi:hypothetical protein